MSEDDRPGTSRQLEGPPPKVPCRDPWDNNHQQPTADVYRSSAGVGSNKGGGGQSVVEETTTSNDIIIFIFTSSCGMGTNYHEYQTGNLVGAHVFI